MFYPVARNIVIWTSYRNKKDNDSALSDAAVSSRKPFSMALDAKILDIIGFDAKFSRKPLC